MTPWLESAGRRLRPGAVLLARGLGAAFTNLWVNRVVFVAVLVYLVVYVADKTSVDDFRKIRIDPGWCVLSAVLAFGYQLAYVAIWHHITRLLDIPFPFVKTLAIWSYSNLGKYLPLKVAKYGYRISLYSVGTGFPAQQVVKATFVESLASVIGGFVLFLLLLPLVDTRLPLLDLGASVLACIVLLAFLIVTSSRRFDSFVSRHLGFSLVSEHITKVRQLQLIGFYVVAWVIAGAAFFCAARAVVPAMDGLSMIEAMSFFAFGGVVGIVALFAPSGLGVREGILLFFLSRFLPLPEATAIVILSRVIILVVEFACVAYGFFFIQLERAHASTE